MRHCKGLGSTVSAEDARRIGEANEQYLLTATTLEKPLYTVFSPDGYIPAGDIVPSAWLPGVSKEWLPGLPGGRPAVAPTPKSDMPMLALYGAAVLAAFYFLNRR